MKRAALLRAGVANSFVPHRTRVARSSHWRCGHRQVLSIFSGPTVHAKMNSFCMLTNRCLCFFCINSCLQGKHELRQRIPFVIAACALVLPLPQTSACCSSCGHKTGRRLAVLLVLRHNARCTAAFYQPSDSYSTLGCMHEGRRRLSVAPAATPPLSRAPPPVGIPSHGPVCST